MVTGQPRPACSRADGLPIGYGQGVRARWAWALLAACIAVAGLCRASSPNEPAGPISLAAGWQFALDPANQGLRSGWQLPATVFPSQRTMATGQSLADQGIPKYRGIAWFRRTVTLPDGWSRPVLGFGAVDVACDLYVNGHLAGHFEDQTLGARAAVVDLATFARPGQRVTLVLRVVGTGGFGGIKQPVELGSAPEQVMTGKQYELYLHNQHPSWRMPAWTGGAPLAWTVAGVQGALTKAVINTDGSFSPWAGSWSVAFWLYDPGSRRLVAFPPPSASLADGSSPVPVFDFRAGPWRLREELAVAGSAAQPAVTARLTLIAGPHAALLYAALRPFTASGGLAAIPGIAFRGRDLLVAGAPALAATQGPAVTGGTVSGADVSVAAAERAGLAEGVLRETLAPGASTTFLAPGGPGVPLPAAAADPSEVARQWQRTTHAVQIHLPEAQLEAAYYSSLAYMLVEQRGNQIHPGPLVHNAFWVRDAALIGYALERAGLVQDVRGSAEATLAAIQPDGHVIAVTAASGQPEAAVELDAPGEAAFSLAEYARFSGDGAFLRRAYGPLMLALHTALGQRGADGLLPANQSAEDLGPASQQHYWDDLWLLTGLQEGQWAATRLGHSGDVAELTAAEDQLRQALLAAVAGTRAGYIPNNAGDTTSSAMARGSSPALWPLQVLDPSSTLVRASFAHYDATFIQPFSGAYHHLYGQWWPYGGLELAHDFLFLGMRQPLWQVLGYTLAHQTAPGLYAWAEGVDPATGGFGEGDMPHGWAAAELANLVRDMLLYGQGSQLVVGAGVPASWAGHTISIANAPTRWGNASVIIDPGGAVRVSGVHPPGGVVLKLPFPAHLLAS